MEPVSPRVLDEQVPRDAEMIGLKCPHEEANKRYDNALSLAEDLGRFQLGEPIRARPVSRSERLVKWVRGNPLVAGLTTAMTAVVVLSMTALSLLVWYALTKANLAGTRANAEAEAKAWRRLRRRWPRHGPGQRRRPKRRRRRNSTEPRRRKIAPSSTESG